MHIKSEEILTTVYPKASTNQLHLSSGKTLARLSQFWYAILYVCNSVCVQYVLRMFAWFYLWPDEDGPKINDKHIQIWVFKYHVPM